MKHLWIFCILLLAMACSKDESQTERFPFNAEILPQKWELFRMSGSLAGSETEGAEMQWQESYVLRGNDTFTKKRSSEDGTIEAGGTFEFILEEDGSQGVLFTYQEGSDIIGNCTGTNSEYLYLRDEEQTLQSTWWACDGPGLFYQRVE